MLCSSNMNSNKLQNLKQLTSSANKYTSILKARIYTNRKDIIILRSRISRLKIQNQAQEQLATKQIKKNQLQFQQTLETVSTFESLIEQLSDRALQIQGAKGAGKRILIGIAGVPGGGKSTISSIVSNRINERIGEDIAKVLPMDGFHYTKAYLAQMENPEEARFRRGAHWTFDAKSFVDCVKRVTSEPTVFAPSFEHGVGDPVDNDIRIDKKHVIVFVEGNYVLLGIEPWNQLKTLFDESWFVNCPLDEAMDRLFKRQTGNGVPVEISNKRISGNDRLNGELILDTQFMADVIIPTVRMQ
eukprot:TRINITY_DN3965_c0_g1_i2.p1 TRINITY_DN3965_c0_g1~~TRINITY_DN3965_c0_g1_i2.p1  ORF type:complete len:301 (+),score=20.40 TRINITY_DN3965_c0_g1_i2:139-1041(+)